MAQETTYVTAIEYTVKDKASAPLNKVAKAADHTAKNVKVMKERLAKVNTSLAASAKNALRTTVAFAGIGGAAASIALVWKEIASFETQTKTLAGVMAQTFDFRPHMTMVEKFRASLGEARKDLDRMDASGTAMGHTLGAMTSMFSKLGAATAGMGLTKTQLLELTESAAALSTAFGDVPAQVAEVLGVALSRGTISTTGSVGKFLNAQFTKEELKGFKTNRIGFLNELKKRTTGVKEMAIEMNQTLTGSVFKVMDALADAARLVMQPAANSLTDALSGWAKSVGAWIKTKDAAAWADNVRDAFKDIRDATKWIASHWKEIAVIWLGMRAASAAAGLAEGAGALGGVAGNLARVGKKASLAAVGLAAVYLGAQAFADWVDKQQGKAIKKAGEAQAFVPAAFAEAQKIRTARGTGEAEAAARTTISHLRSMGALAGGELQRKALISGLHQLSKKEFAAMQSQLGIEGARPGRAHATVALADHMGKMVKYMQATMPDVFKARKRADGIDEEMKQKISGAGAVAAKPKITIGKVIITQKFEEGDPDRVFVRLKDSLERLAENPTQTALNPAFAD